MVLNPWNLLKMLVTVVSQISRISLKSQKCKTTARPKIWGANGVHEGGYFNAQKAARRIA